VSGRARSLLLSRLNLNFPEKQGIIFR